MPNNQQRAFVSELAHFLVGKQVELSFRLGVGDEHAREWARLRATTPLFGYPSMEEAEKVLLEFLFNNN
jgi:hypothetical protein